jgi:hypothetical protein
MITIPLKKTIIVMFVVVATLTAVDIILGSNGVFDRSRAGVTENYHRLLHFFDLAAEANAPTWFKSAMFGFAATLLFLIGSAKRHARDEVSWYWFFMAFTFLFLSVDETTSLHKAVGALVARYVPKEGLFVHAWLIPGSIFAVLFVVINWKFLGTLPRSTGNLFVFGGTLFVLGAIGMKLIEGIYASTTGLTGQAAINLRAIDQFLEMAGLLLFNFSLMAYCRDQLQGIRIRFI